MIEQILGGVADGEVKTDRKDRQKRQTEKTDRQREADYQKCRKAPCFSYGDIRHNLSENSMFLLLLW